METSSAMASASSTMDVDQEVKCPICMDYLTGPVTLDCGHNFCKDCITNYCETWEDLGEILECPLCKAKIKRGNFRHNWQLASIAEKIKCLGKGHLCVRHKEKLHLFCKEDKELVCLICERSPEHRSHKVMLLDEAAKECKDQLYSCLEDLKKEQERILENKAGIEKESRDMLGQIEEKKIRTVALFNQLQQFLEDQKMGFLSQLEELEKEIAIRREQHMARLIEKLSSLKGLIQQMEQKCQQPASELLKDIRRTLERYEKMEVYKNQMVFPPVLIYRNKGFHDVKPLLERVMKQFPGANVTLDPDTAHPQLILSEDLKSVRWGDKLQTLPNNPERFDRMFFVLGCEGFTAGRQFWDVTMESEGAWAVGVARKSVKRKGWIHFSPAGGIWAVGKWGDDVKDMEMWREGYRISNPPDYSLSQELKRIRVTLNWAEEQVSFSDADTGVHLKTYPRTSFSGETLLPFFYVDGKAHLRLSS